MENEVETDTGTEIDLVIKKTKDFIQAYLDPIIYKENDNIDPNIFSNESMFCHWDKLRKESTIHNILEIGFGAGFSAVFMLYLLPDVKVTSVDLGFHRYTYGCFEKIKEHFGEDRINLFLGDSNRVIPIIKGSFDLVYYDGSDAYDVTEKDIIYSYPLLHENTIFVFAKWHLLDLWEKYITLFQLDQLDSTFSTHFRKRNRKETNHNSIEFINENRDIPKKIFRFWQTDLCEKMQYYSNILKNENLEFEYAIFNIETAREFLKEHFDPEIVYTFDILIPFAYKSDFFRYCILYIYGGIYLDMKFQSVNGFRFSQLIDKEQYVLDIDETSVYNALLICKPHSKIMFKCIFQVVKNVKEKNYTENDLTVTGPGMMKYLVPKEIKQESKLRHQCINYNKYILRDGVPILKNYHRYYEDTPKCGQKKYLEYWHNREIFMDPSKEIKV